MSLIDKAKQHLQSAAGVAQHAAETALEAGQTLSAQAQTQVNLRKLQIEQARKTHELGKETYAWHQSGTMIVSGPVPRQVQMLCFQLDDLGEKIEAENLRLEEIKRLAESRAQQSAAHGDVSVITSADVSPSPATPPASASAPQLPGNFNANANAGASANASTRPLPGDDTIS